MRHAVGASPVVDRGDICSSNVRKFRFSLCPQYLQVSHFYKACRQRFVVSHRGAYPRSIGSGRVRSIDDVVDIKLVCKRVNPSDVLAQYAFELGNALVMNCSELRVYLCHSLRWRSVMIHR